MSHRCVFAKTISKERLFIMKKRMIFLTHLKSEKIEEYKEHHRNVWPELQEAYREAGITQISCFLHDNQLLVFTEYDEAIYPAAKAALGASEVEQRWAQLMRPLADSDFKPIEFEEVFYMPPSDAL